MSACSPYFWRLFVFRLCEVSTRVLSLALLAHLGGLAAASALLLLDWVTQAALILRHRATHAHRASSFGCGGAAVFALVFMVVHFIGLSERPVYIPHRSYYALRLADLLVVLSGLRRWRRPARLHGLCRGAADRLERWVGGGVH